MDLIGDGVKRDPHGDEGDYGFQEKASKNEKFPLHNPAHNPGEQTRRDKRGKPPQRSYEELVQRQVATYGPYVGDAASKHEVRRTKMQGLTRQNERKGDAACNRTRSRSSEYERKQTPGTERHPGVQPSSSCASRDEQKQTPGAERHPKQKVSAAGDSQEQLESNKPCLSSEKVQCNIPEPSGDKGSLLKKLGSLGKARNPGSAAGTAFARSLGNEIRKMKAGTDRSGSLYVRDVNALARTPVDKIQDVETSLARTADLSVEKRQDADTSSAKRRDAKVVCEKARWDPLNADD